MNIFAFGTTRWTTRCRSARLSFPPPRRAPFWFPFGSASTSFGSHSVLLRPPLGSCSVLRRPPLVRIRFLFGSLRFSFGFASGRAGFSSVRRRSPFGLFLALKRSTSFEPPLACLGAPGCRQGGHGSLGVGPRWVPSWCFFGAEKKYFF